MAARAAPTTERPSRTRAAPRAEQLKEASTPELVTSIASDMSQLVRTELELGKREITDAVVSRLEGVAAIGLAGVLAVVALVFIGLAGAAALADDIAPWAAALIVAAVYAVLAGLAAVLGRRRATHRSLTPERAVETTKEDVAWVKAQLKR